MKIWAVAALAIVLSVGVARADDIQKALDTVSASLEKDGSGLVPFYGACPKKNPDDDWQYAGSSTIVFINQSDRAVLFSAGYCNGGNGSSQYLVIIQNGAATLIRDIGLEDMNFLADTMHTDDDTLFLYGSRWMKKDPHCCPSRKATLEYNLKTHQHKLTLVPKS